MPRRSRRRPHDGDPHPSIAPPLSAQDVRLARLVLALAVAAVLALFIGRAVHMDDPLFIWMAQQVRLHPFDPYGFSLNWYGGVSPMSDVMKNPPLVSYYLAVVSIVAGWREAWLHAALIVPAVAAALGIFTLARRWTTLPAVAVAASLITPAFLVSSLTIMSDVTMLAFWVWAIEAWCRGLERRRAGWLVLGGVLIAAAALSKYFGIALLPLLLVYTVLKERRITAQLFVLAIPVVILAGYQSATAALYGRGLLLDATLYAPASGRAGSTLIAVGACLAFTGGCLASAVIFAPHLWSRRALAVWITLGGVIAWVSATAAIADVPFAPMSAARIGFALQFGLWAAGGASLIALTITDLRHRRDADAWLLALWLGGTLAFAGVVNWTTNARALLPAIVPAGIIIARRMEGRPWAARGRTWRSVPAAATIAAAVIAGVVMWADTSQANAVRRLAQSVCAQYANSGHPLRFEGHWGFQYYLEHCDARAMNFRVPEAAPGDVIAFPTNNTNVVPPPANRVTTIGQLKEPGPSWIATMSLDVGAGFYSSAWGALPFVVARVPPERVRIDSVHAPQ